MNIILALIPVTLLVVALAVRLFFWAVNHQQFDDLDSPAILPLLEDADDPDQGGQRDGARCCRRDDDAADAAPEPSPPPSA